MSGWRIWLMDKETRGISKEVQDRIYNMVQVLPLENPCDEFEEIGFKYEYIKGMVDQTPYYVRFEEDRIVYTSEDGRIKIQFNLGAHGLVISKQGSNGEYYGGYETFFLSGEVCLCISKVIRKLGW